MKARVDSRWLIPLILFLVCLVGPSVYAVQLGDATITLQSHRYYKQWDLTRFVYRVKSPSQTRIPDFWILGTADCVSGDQVDVWSSTPFTWAEQPLAGIQFPSYWKNERFYLWLNGQWDAGAIDIAAVFDADGEGAVYRGSIDGPACEGSSIALEVASGGQVGFEPLLHAGTFASSETTRLSVSSSSSGWSLDYALAFAIPEEAQQSTVERILDVFVTPHSTSAGTTDIEVSYTLDVENADFSGLPEGTYVIGITYTVTADN